jgi:hypothetical protein
VREAPAQSSRDDQS